MITITPTLKQAIKGAGYTGQTLAPLIGLSPQSFSQRKRGTAPWLLDECYQILDVLEIPRQKIYLYFTGGEPNEKK
jgi:DNA-binding XRE family transcriptional regulator